MNKILTICGFKIKFKISISKKYKKIINRIKNKIKKSQKVKVIFLVSENQKWGYQSLYDLLATDNRFEPIILISLLTTVHHGFDKTRNNLKENFDFFKSKGMNVDFCYKNGEYIPLEEFKPDIVFYEQMWDLPPHYMPDHVSNFALTCYTTYGFEFFNNTDNYTDFFHKKLWKNFVDNKLNIKRYKQYIKDADKNCVACGYLKLDEYLNIKEKESSDIWKYPHKKRIIYAPHHAFEPEGLNLATFKTNGNYILELAKKHKDTCWIFKPHPRFKHAIIINNIMTEDEINNYYNEWEEIGSVYTKGDYFDIFKSSDLLITDCCSFLGEYLPTKKPIIRLVNPMARSFNSFGKIVSNSCYCVQENNELNNVFVQLINDKNDFKQKERLKTLNKIINFKQKSANRIFKHLKNNLIK